MRVRERGARLRHRADETPLGRARIQGRAGREGPTIPGLRRLRHPITNEIITVPEDIAEELKRMWTEEARSYCEEHDTKDAKDNMVVLDREIYMLTDTHLKGLMDRVDRMAREAKA